MMMDMGMPPVADTGAPPPEAPPAGDAAGMISQALDILVGMPDPDGQIAKATDLLTQASDALRQEEGATGDQGEDTGRGPMDEMAARGQVDKMFGR